MSFSTVAPAPIQVDDRPSRLVDAARDLANETGSSAFTVNQVAARAGLSLKAFYRCFPSKDALLLALIEDDGRIGAEIVAARMREAPDPLRAFVVELFGLAGRLDAAGYAGILVREHRRLAEHHPEALQIALASLTDLLAAHIDSADPARDAATMLTVLINGIGDVVCGRVTDVADYAEYLYQFCAHGLDGLQ